MCIFTQNKSNVLYTYTYFVSLIVLCSGGTMLKIFIWSHAVE